MKIIEAKKIIEKIELSNATKRMLEVLMEGEEEREMSSKEIRQLVALIEAEIENDRDEATEIEESVFKLKNILSSADNAAELFDKSLKGLE